MSDGMVMENVVPTVQLTAEPDVLLMLQLWAWALRANESAMAMAANLMERFIRTDFLERGLLESDRGTRRVRGGGSADFLWKFRAVQARDLADYHISCTLSVANAITITFGAQLGTFSPTVLSLSGRSLKVAVTDRAAPCAFRGFLRGQGFARSAPATAGGGERRADARHVVPTIEKDTAEKDTAQRALAGRPLQQCGDGLVKPFLYNAAKAAVIMMTGSAGLAARSGVGDNGER
jgi:hypothetical protein